jgi:hypothetical protein
MKKYYVKLWLRIEDDDLLEAGRVFKAESVYDARIAGLLWAEKNLGHRWIDYRAEATRLMKNRGGVRVAVQTREGFRFFLRKAGKKRVLVEWNGKKVGIYGTMMWAVREPDYALENAIEKMKEGR